MLGNQFSSTSMCSTLFCAKSRCFWAALIFFTVAIATNTRKHFDKGKLNKDGINARFGLTNQPIGSWRMWIPFSTSFSSAAFLSFIAFFNLIYAINARTKKEASSSFYSHCIKYCKAKADFHLFLMNLFCRFSLILCILGIFVTGEESEGHRKCRV